MPFSRFFERGAKASVPRLSAITHPCSCLSKTLALVRHTRSRAHAPPRARRYAAALCSGGAIIAVPEGILVRACVVSGWWTQWFKPRGVAVMRATTAGVFLVVTLAASSQSEDTVHKCVLDGPMDPSTGSSNQLVLPVRGKDVCQTVREHCGGGRQGALCVKAALETILPDDRHVDAIRSSMHVSPEFYFLCAGTDSLGHRTGSARVARLTDLLRRAVSQGSLETRPETRQGAQHVEADYRHAARWSELTGWTVEEKVEHFVHALEMLPDNPHCVDRLAVALREGGDALLDGSPGPPANVLRGMLLHYAVLRRIISHPLQRPLSLTPGLTARPFWNSQPSDCNDVAWLGLLVRPCACAGLFHLHL